MTEMPGAPGGDRNSDPTGHPQLAIVSVADLLDRRVPLEWFESVAIVAGLCSTLVDTQTPGVPASPHILLAHDGTIAIGGPGVRHEVDALPRVLHELLAVIPPPTALRLFVLHSISSEAEKTPATFGKSLEYYERPGRADIIRAVRQKYFETPMPQPGSAAPEPFALPDKPAKADQQPSATAPRRRRWLVAACAGVGAGAVGIVALTTGGSGRSDAFGSMGALVTHAAEASRGIASSIAETLTARGNNTTAVSVENAEAPAPAPPARKARRTKRSQSGARSEATAEQAAAPVSATVGVIEPGNAVSTDEAAAEPSESVSSPAPTVVSSEWVTYQLVEGNPVAGDSTSTQIIPPRLLEPIRLPSWVDPVHDKALNAIELEIGVDGTVEHIRMLSPAVTLTDMMILSAAKTWVFEPASFEGRPVPYRLTLSLTPNR